MTKEQKIQTYYNQKEKLSLTHKKYAKQVQWIVEYFISEDLDTKGDLTTEAMIKKNTDVSATMTAKQSGVLAGIEEITWICKKYDIRVNATKQDGDTVQKGDDILTLHGTIKEVLILERTILNIMQRMSGIATHTKSIIDVCDDQVLICPTRKTHWGLLDKKAVILGGGGTHRLGLYDFILIKDNHIAFAGKDVDKRLNEIKETKQFWEIEAKTEEQIYQFITYNPDVIMLDNFTPEQIKNILEKIKQQDEQAHNTIFEASGGITKTNVAEYAKSGVDVISLGALTHSVTVLDISLNIA